MRLWLFRLLNVAIVGLAVLLAALGNPSNQDRSLSLPGQAEIELKAARQKASYDWDSCIRTSTGRVPRLSLRIRTDTGRALQIERIKNGRRYEKGRCGINQPKGRRRGVEVFTFVTPYDGRYRVETEIDRRLNYDEKIVIDQPGWVSVLLYIPATLLFFCAVVVFLISESRYRRHRPLRPISYRLSRRRSPRP